jgi:ketosteroid isomerase-like protein
VLEIAQRIPTTSGRHLFRYHKPGTAFDFRELAVTAGVDVAFAVAVMWCGSDSSSNPIDKDAFCSD